MATISQPLYRFSSTNTYCRLMSAITGKTQGNNGLSLEIGRDINLYVGKQARS